MFYFLRSPYMETLEVLEEAVTLAGDNTIYTTFVPYATVVVYLFVEEEMTKEDARAVHARLNEIADHNIQNNEQLGVYYQQAKDAMNAKFAEIEDFIFDCEYFKNKLVPEYKADPENVDLVRMVYNKLLSKGCDKGEGIMVELQTKYETYAAQENARRVAEFEENNPQVVAKRLYDEGDFPGAIEKYEEAIEKADNDDDKAQYHFAIASIQFRKLSQYASARTSAYKAAELREGWGRPYLLIGDMYGTTSSSCGSNAYERGLAVLAALDKYSYAKSIDPEVEDEANRSIARYSQYIPPQDDVFMRGKKRGDRESVPCWIGETVALRYN
jgi:tetratricopeptide (TPR) repeat protein